MLALTQTAVTAKEMGITAAPLSMAEEGNQGGADLPLVEETTAAVPGIEELDETSAPTPMPTINLTENPPLIYYTQQGDTLAAVAAHFNVSPDEIYSGSAFSSGRYLPVGVELLIPERIGDTGPIDVLMPDTEVVYSPSAADFDIEAFARDAGGYLSTYSESTSEGTMSGTRVIERIAIKYSINPRLLLALLEYQSGWVYGTPGSGNAMKYPLGFYDANHESLERQLNWAAQNLSSGYYGWRMGMLDQIVFPNQGRLTISPYLNAGTVALHVHFAKLRNVDAWFDTFYGNQSFIDLYNLMFGDAWARASANEPSLSDRLVPPAMELPFASGQAWNFTGGPHEAWGTGTAWGALDFAPMGVQGCEASTDWITSVASGTVVRSENATVVVDMDKDGSEQTGWVIFYFHVKTEGRIPAGVEVNTNDRLGHPSCEGGSATGTHVHIARKYNGEWIPAGEPGLAFEMSGWQAYYGAKVYEGLMIKNEEIIRSSSVSTYASSVRRP